MDEPLREVGPDLVPLRTPTQREETPNPSSPTVPAKQPDPIPASPNAQSARPKKRKPQQTEKSIAQVAAPDPSTKPERAESVATPKAESEVAESSFRESAKEFAGGFGKGVRDEGERTYREAKELPARIARTGRELVEDVREEVTPARATGEMYGQRVVREWNPETGQSRTCQETLDHEAADDGS